MKLDLISIKNLVEWNMRFFKIGGYDPKTKPKYDNTIPPDLNNKPDNELGQWAVNSTLAMGADGKIAINVKNDNNTNLRDMIAQSIYDVLTDANASSDLTKLSISGQKLVDKDGNETIVGNYYGGGGDKTSPGLGNILFEVDSTKTLTLKVGDSNQIINASSLTLLYVLYGMRVDSTGVMSTSDGGITWTPLLNSAIVDSKAEDSAVVHNTGNETVSGIKTFTSFPVTPSANPTSDYEVVNKQYADLIASGGGLTVQPVTNSTTLNIATDIAIFTGTSGKTITLRLADYLSPKTKRITIKNASNYDLTIAAQVTNTIEGDPSIIMRANSSRDFTSDASTSWYVI